ncbi:transcriptional regulator [Bacillus sp. MUM 13]|uniref:MarR family winged helix-turn-helix transcriptional regulator n=1 Tax=Bacillus sp. MUM 13 TaxID=1678001 RepID=UPI0008F57D14|nr:transcriptional regulator [Bacillus sp. MUM 13]OIK12698.1 hypothetical protein BIV59_07695 [Bacillus sp. MUM 13]
MDRILDMIEYEIALLNRLTNAISPKLGKLDRSGYILLSKVIDGNPAGINEIAEELKLNVSTASRQVAALEEKEYISRTPDQKNGRISLITITDLGREVFNSVKKARTDAYAAILHNWPKKDLEELESSLSKLNSALVLWNRP